MKKLVIVALSAVLALVATEPAQAESTPTIAIIDTAVDSSKIKNVIYEACFTQESSCLNKTKTQEGIGSANVLKWTSRLDHGNQVAQAAVAVNPNIKIVFIRIADERPEASKRPDHSYDQSRQEALQWILLNAEKFNIRTVSISASLGLQTPSTCLSYPGYSEVRSVTQSLLLKNVVVFAATGNNGDKSRIGFPACIDNVVAVGATKPNGTWATYSNTGTGLSGTGVNVVARGDAQVVMFGKPGLNTATGTSIATPVVATLTATNITGKTFEQLVATLPNKIGYPHFGK
jgi:hypothetical protein